MGFIADDDNTETKSSDKDSDDESGVDSDDESITSAHGNTEEDEAFMEEYMAAMDAELQGTTLQESFEQLSSSSSRPQQEDVDAVPVDVDRNLLKYLLESFKAQMGAAGPASNLMRELGLDIPVASAVEIELDEDSA